MAILKIDDYHQFEALRSVRTPRIIRVVSLLVVLGIAGTIAFLIYTPWVQTTAGAGTVTALNPNDRQQQINALVSGRIDRWFVQDGSVVKEGDPIARIIDNDPNLIERLVAERGQVEIQLQAAEAGLRTAQIDADRMKDLFESGLAAQREYEQARIRVEEFRGRVAEAAANLNRVDVSLSRQSVQMIAAPRDGIILNLIAGNTATYVNAGDVLATFVPDTQQRVIEIFIDGRDVALVQPGAKVRIQFEGWPAVQFTGWPSQAVGTFGGIVTAVDPSAQVNGRFRILISEDPDDPQAWPDQRYVRFGANVRAWILLETVPLGYELWRQLNNFPPSLPQPGADSSGSGQTA